MVLDQPANLPTQLGQENRSDDRKLLIFKLGDELYGIDIHWIYEIRRYDSVTTVSDLPNFVKGIASINEDAMLVIDLRILFKMNSITYNEFTLLIILKIGNHRISLVTNEVLDVLAIKETEINLSSDIISLIPKHYIMGLIKFDNKLLMVLDIEKLFESEILNLTAKQQNKLMSSD